MHAPPSIFNRWSGRLSHRRLPLFAALVAVALSLPGLFIGFQLDDFFHRRFMLQSEQMGVRPIDVFASLSGDSSTQHRLIDAGALPWWTADQFRLAFCRYFAAASMMLDYRLWPNSPVLMHVHSLIWYGALVLFAALLYRRLLVPPWAAGLAALLFALDEAHAVPAAWLANRNALMAVAFSLAALWAHDRGRRDGWRWGGVLSALLLFAGLFSGEMAVGVLAYLGAYALGLDRGSSWERLRSLLPALVAFGIWAAAYRALGLGAEGSGFYLDPLREPVAYAAAFLRRGPILLMGQWTPVPADFGMLLPPESTFVLTCAGLVVIAVVALLFWLLVRGRPQARFFALGSIGALVPLTGVAPSNRLLFLVGFGSMGLLAAFFAAFMDRKAPLAERPWIRRLTAATLGVFAVFHLVVAPLAKPYMAYSSAAFGSALTQAVDSLPTDSALASQDLVFVNSPDYLFGVSVPLTIKALAGEPLPRHIRALVCGPTPLHVLRLNDRTLRVMASGGMFRGTLGRLFRSPADRLTAGHLTTLTGMAAAVVETNSAGDPTVIDFRFDRPLEDPDKRWLQWNENRYLPFVPPRPGDTLEIAPAFGSFDMFWNQPGEGDAH